MFEKVIECYKDMSILDKQETNIDELKKMIAIVEKICIDRNIPYRQIKSKEILEFDKSNEDYLEAEFVYISYLKEVLWSLLASQN